MLQPTVSRQSYLSFSCAWLFISLISSPFPSYPSLPAWPTHIQSFRCSFLLVVVLLLKLPVLVQLMLQLAPGSTSHEFNTPVPLTGSPCTYLPDPFEFVSGFLASHKLAHSNPVPNWPVLPCDTPPYSTTECSIGIPSSLLPVGSSSQFLVH